MNTLDLAIVLDELKWNQLVWIWHIACRFTRYAVRVNLMFTREPDQHHLTALIFKIDHMKTRWGRNIELVFHPYQKFSQNYASTNRENLVPAYLDYLRSLGLEYVVYVESNILLSRESKTDIFDLCDQKENWFTQNSYFYGKNLLEDRNWIKLGDPVYQDDTELSKYSPGIGIFTSNTIKGNYYTSWFNYLSEQYKQDENIYAEEIQ
jgi:hypothetical protein